MMGAIVSKDKRIDLTQFEGIMNIEWLFDEELFVGEQHRWRFAINEYTDTTTMSKKEYEEWENGLESLWDSLTSAIAYLPDLLAELKRMYELEDKLRTVIATLDFEYGIAAKLLGEVEPASE